MAPVNLSDYAKKRAALETSIDRRVLQIIQKHGMQTFFESIRRVVAAQAEANTKVGMYNHKWKMALNIVEIADRALYGQHCGDVPPEHLRTGYRPKKR
jgi:hypothetical protein